MSCASSRRWPASSRDDLEHLLSTNEVLEIACEYCKRDFRIAPARLRGLLEQS